MFMDLVKEFQLSIPGYRSHTRDWKSGKEAADWIAFNLEEQGRLLGAK